MKNFIICLLVCLFACFVLHACSTLNNEQIECSDSDPIETEELRNALNEMSMNFKQSGNPLVLLFGYEYFNIDVDTETRTEENSDGISEEDVLRLLERFDVVNGDFDYEGFILELRDAILKEQGNNCFEYMAYIFNMTTYIIAYNNIAPQDLSNVNYIGDFVVDEDKISKIISDVKITEYEKANLTYKAGVVLEVKNAIVGDKPYNYYGLCERRRDVAIDNLNAKYVFFTLLTGTAALAIEGPVGIAVTVFGMTVNICSTLTNSYNKELDVIMKRYSRCIEDRGY